MRLNSVEQKGYANRIMDWKIFVRQDLVAAKACQDAIQIPRRGRRIRLRDLHDALSLSFLPLSRKSENAENLGR
jgi:hypothetical protein